MLAILNGVGLANHSNGQNNYSIALRQDFAIANDKYVIVKKNYIP